jgi:hypothetical protein
MALEPLLRESPEVVREVAPMRPDCSVSSNLQLIGSDPVIAEPVAPGPSVRFRPGQFAIGEGRATQTLPGKAASDRQDKRA